MEVNVNNYPLPVLPMTEYGGERLWVIVVFGDATQMRSPSKM
jgi:hypothetical protein